MSYKKNKIKWPTQFNTFKHFPTTRPRKIGFSSSSLAVVVVVSN